MAVRIGARDDHVREIGARGDQIGELRKQFFRDDQDPRPAVGEHEAIVVLGHQRVDRDRDDARLDGAEESGRPVDGVEQRQQDALLAPDPERAQRIAEAIDPVGELTVGPASARIDIGRLAGAAGVEIALQYVGGEVVAARNRSDGRAGIDFRRERIGSFGECHWRVSLKVLAGIRPVLGGRSPTS